ncbi:MAG TPA: transposase [Candidatus Ozemobacteraceae bacterium]|nr:transposase [Candidatus Ozemobacteraceae bacterium]
MARMSRVVGVGLPHHVTQRGNRRMPTFFSSDDYRTYLSILSEWCQKTGVEIWAYCLMPNHVHLIAVPSQKNALARGIGETHRRYSRMVNFREGWKGFLWQDRFHSCLLDQAHLHAAVRYVELNPVTAGLVQDPFSYPWSSAAAHLQGIDNHVVKVSPMLEFVAVDWREFLRHEPSQDFFSRIRLHSRTGRPLGNESFLSEVERLVGKSLRPGRPGPKPSRERG